MRLVILTQYFLPEMGAPQSRLFELARGLKNAGWEVSVITALPNYPTGKIFAAYRRKFTTINWVEGIETKRYWLYASNAPRALPRIVSMMSFSLTVLFSIFYLRSKRPDYLLVESPPLTLGFSAWVLSLLSGSKFILNVSDLWPLSAKELGAIREGFVYRQLLKLERFLYRKAAVVTGQSEEIVSYVQQAKARRSYLFRNGVDTTRFINAAYDPRKRNCLVYAGLLGVAQGVLAICRNVDFKALGMEFHIYGSGAEQKDIVNFLAQNKENGIEYLGTISRDSMPDVLSSYGGALIPLVKNIYGAVPSKIYEAMAAALPILFSGDGEGSAIISENDAGWVNKPGDWKKLVCNIHEFKNLEPSMFARKRRLNKAIAEEHFNRNNQIVRFSEFLTTLNAKHWQV